MVESVRKNPTASKKPKKLVKEPPVEPAEPVEHLSVPEEVKNSLEDPHSQDHPSRSSLYGGFLMMDVFKQESFCTWLHEIAAQFDEQKVASYPKIGQFTFKKVDYSLFTFNRLQQNMFLTEMGFSAEECKDYGVAIMLKNFDISENLRIMIYKVGDDVRFYNSKYDDLCDQQPNFLIYRVSVQIINKYVSSCDLSANFSLKADFLKEDRFKKIPSKVVNWIVQMFHLNCYIVEAFQLQMQDVCQRRFLVFAKGTFAKQLKNFCIVQDNEVRDSAHMPTEGEKNGAISQYQKKNFEQAIATLTIYADLVKKRALDIKMRMAGKNSLSIHDEAFDKEQPLFALDDDLL